MSDLADRIQLGVLYLDDTQPGWQDRIDILKLDINLYDSCILGQVRGTETTWDGYLDQTWHLHDWLDKQGITVENAAVKAGFDGGPWASQHDMQALTRAWVEVLGR